MIPSFADVADLIGRHRFRFGNEAELQAGLAQVFIREGVDFAREYSIPGVGTIDFLVGEGIGVEVKVAGGPAAVAHQLTSYAESDELNSLVLVTSRVSHHRLLAYRQALLRKPFRSVLVDSGGLA